MTSDNVETTLLVIDTYFSAKFSTLLFGWAYTTKLLNSYEVEVYSNKSRLGHDLVWFERPDVSDHIKPKEGDFCQGFVIEVDGQISDLSHLDFLEHTYHFDLASLHRSHAIDEFLVGLNDLQKAFVESKLNLNVSLSESSEAPVISKDYDAVEIVVDRAFSVGNKFLYLEGWVAESADMLKSLQIAGFTGNVVNYLYRYKRLDLKKFANSRHCDYRNMGFYALIPCRVDRLDNPLKLRLKGCSKSKQYSDRCIDIQPLPIDEVAATRIILGKLDAQHTQNFNRAASDFSEALQLIWHNKLSNEYDPEVHTFGKAKDHPEVSVVVPIYGRYDFVQHQIINFYVDDDFKNVELIYVLDDPSIYRDFLITCNGVFNTFGYPFKVIFANTNLGFAGANNLGVKYSSSEYILLLNSDVIPSKPGWLKSMLTNYENIENIGILGVSLHYEDHTIQHVGMQFFEDAHHPGIWLNHHPNKGFPSSIIEPFEIKSVEAVTGACMFISRAIFNQVGGFDTGYILGDFEDSDLCLKVIELGHDIYVDGTNSLFHLERQSQNLIPSDGWKHTLTLLNGWRQKQKWDTTIKEMKQRG